MDTTCRCLLFKDNPWPAHTPRDGGCSEGGSGFQSWRSEWRAGIGSDRCVRPCRWAFVTRLRWRGHILTASHSTEQSWAGFSYMSTLHVKFDWRPVCAVFFFFLSSACEESLCFGFILSDRSSTLTLSFKTRPENTPTAAFAGSNGAF